MNEIVNTFLLAGDKLMPEMHLNNLDLLTMLVGHLLQTQELHEPVIRKFRQKNFYSGFKDNIWGVDLADMQLISKFNKGFRSLLCAIDIFSKFAWVVLLKDKS